MTFALLPVLAAVQQFGPLAKEALVNRLAYLQALEAEALVAEVLVPLTAATPPGEPLMQVALNLAGDAQGG